jgi:DNA-binding transcriptional regulator GbsR (MarR family)
MDSQSQEETPESRYQIEEMNFIEDTGLFFERMGMPRMAGRILGVLLISDPPAQSITDLEQKLNASKSSISIMTRLLLENGLIERAPSSIPRRDYYKFKEGGWMLYLQQWLSVITDLNRITERGLALIHAKPQAMKERLQEAHDLFTFLQENFPVLIENLAKERKSRN